MSNQPTWTPAQLTAIETRGKTLLVSAAAGSGKTATLTERIIRSITREEDPADLSRMLIVTFTRASAADLRKKISAALSSALAADPTNRHLASQIMLLGSARISTIDSFYKDILDNNFQKLSLPGNMRIIDDAENALLCRSVMEEVIDEFYAREEDFEDFVDHFAEIRSLDRITDIFLSLYEDVLSFREGHRLLARYERELTEATSTDFFETPYGRAICDETEATLVYIRNILLTAEDYFEGDDTLHEAYLPSFRYDRKTAETLLELVKQRRYNDARTCLEAFAPIRLKTVKNTDEYTNRLKAMRTKAHELLRDLKKNFFSHSPEDIADYMQKTARVCGMASRLLDAFDQKLMGEKQSRGICYFNDVSRYVLRLLLDEKDEPTETALALREQFDEIYIDEYQDTDEVQDLIFRTIAKPTNRFMVGDIKQSIYGFRGAAPSIFAEYKRTMPPVGTEGADACSIFMSNNFRCDENVVRFSNLVSSYLFGNCSESVEYSREDDLVFSKSRDCGNAKTVVALTGLRPEEEEDMEEDSEAIYIANEIHRLLCEEKKNDGTPIEPRDIAILMRKKSKMPALLETLQAAGIPACSSEEHNFFENPDVLLVLSLLSTIDNPQRDVSLAGTLCSPFYGLTLEDIVTLRRSAEDSASLYDALCDYAAKEEDGLAGKCRVFMTSLADWRYRAQALSVDKLLKKLYRDFALLSMQGTDENNLLRLYDYARKFESGGFRGLHGFIRYVNELIEMGTTIGSTGENTSLNAVRLMTIHHSKGLEFPVCFIHGTAGTFSTMFKRQNIQLVPKVGIGFRLHDESGMGFYDTPIRQALINEKSRTEREEEMRILYVAMTRARERLYVTATVTDYDKRRDKARNLAEFGRAFGIIKSTSYLDWILAAIESAGTDSEACDCLTVETYEKGQLTLPAPAASIRADAEADEETADAKIIARLRERFSFTYPFHHVSELPAKLSVSRLYPAVLDEYDDAGAPLEDDPEDESALDDIFTLPESLRREKTISGADRGTATHNFLQFCDFDAVESRGVREELARLTDKKFIPADFAGLVNIRQLETFFRGSLFRRIRTAKRVWREQRFNIFLPASDFTEDAQKAALLENETITVQGVIDLFFEDSEGNIILCDYKTDYLTPEELNTPALAAEKLTRRHSLQLRYYARAIEQMCGKPPQEILIYSLPLGKTVEVV